MTFYKFTDEELKYLMETLDIVLKDIESIRELSPLMENRIQFKALDVDSSWYLEANENAIRIILDGDLKPIVLSERGQKKGLNQKNNFITIHHIDPEHWTTYGHNRILRFLACYSDIRKKLVAELEASTDSKEVLMDELKKLRTNFTSEVFVDFGTSNSQNQHRLEVTEENGKKIGTIDFGQKTIKIITEGEIVLTHTKRAEEKVKSLV